MVRIKGLVKNYEEFHLDCTMEIPDGAVIGIIGKNGAGKSTTIKAILGLIKPDDGEVTVFDKIARELTPLEKEQIGVALAESGFSTYLTVKDICGILKKMYKAFDEKMFMEQCKKQGLPEKKKIHEFSTGMKAKLKVLIAITHDAKLLILDEPTAGLDVTARNEILDMLREYLAKGENRSMLISSHISSDLEGLCDEIYMIHNGQIILHEDTDTILGEYGVLKISEAVYEKLDKAYLLKIKKTPYGYDCLTREKQYYHENYPDIIIENGSIDDLIIMMGSEK